MHLRNRLERISLQRTTGFLPFVPSIHVLGFGQGGSVRVVSPAPLELSLLHHISLTDSVFLQDILFFRGHSYFFEDLRQMLIEVFPESERSSGLS